MFPGASAPGHHQDHWPAADHEGTSTCELSHQTGAPRQLPVGVLANPSADMSWNRAAAATSTPAPAPAPGEQTSRSARLWSIAAPCGTAASIHLPPGGAVAASVMYPAVSGGAPTVASRWLRRLAHQLSAWQSRSDVKAVTAAVATLISGPAPERGRTVVH